MMISLRKSKLILKSPHLFVTKCLHIILSRDTDEDVEPDSEDEGDFDALEKILCQKEKTPDSDDSEDDFSYIGGPKGSAWSIPEKALRFYMKAADINLKKGIY